MLFRSEEFTSGTMGELTPVLEADGRTIGNGIPGELTRRLQALHREVAWRDGEVFRTTVIATERPRQQP